MHFLRYVTTYWRVICLIACSIATTQIAFAQTNGICAGFCLIDNFDDKLNGSIGSQGRWQTNPAGSLDGAIIVGDPPQPISGKALMIDPNGVQFRGNAYVPLDATTIRQGSTGTLFFQIYTENINDTFSHFGLTDLAQPRLTDQGSGDVALYTDFEAQLTIDRGRFRVKHGQRSLNLSNLVVQSATLYNVWMVVNNFTDTFEIYVQGGEHTSPTKGESDSLSIFSFRNGEASADIQTVSLMSDPNFALRSKLYIDNIHVDPDNENLANPVADDVDTTEFSVVASFDSLTLGDLDSQDGWSSEDSSVVVDPLNTTNKVLKVDSRNASKPFRGINDGEQGTVFFRMMRNGLVRASAGLSDIVVPTIYRDFENQVRVRNSSTLSLRDGRRFRSVDRFETDTWYCVWMVTDNSSDQYEVYLKGGTYSEPTRLDTSVLTDFSYRNGSTESLSTFLVKTEPSAGNFFIDDIYHSSIETNLKQPVDFGCSTGQNESRPLSDPIPNKITKSGLGLVLEDFASIPSSNRDIPVARINYLDHANDSSGRLFVNDLRNSLYVIDPNGTTVEYLNVASEFPDFIDSPGLGSGFGFFTFHPEFLANGKFYTVHTEAGRALSNKIPDYSSDAADSVQGVITEWTADNASANVFTGSKREILRVGFDTFIHGFQQIGFNRTSLQGDDDYGLLYIALGDGAQNPTFSNGPQNLSVPHGKILRIDPLRNNAVNAQYGIPPSNPFVTTSDALGEIWAYGLRNPHRFSWDMGGSNQMFIAQIGEKNIDAIFAGFAGANFGWPNREGAFLFKTDDPNNVYTLPANDSQFGYTYPVAQYDHDEGFAVVGGFVYRGVQIPELNGKYIFGDIVNGRIFYTDESQMINGAETTIHEMTLYNTDGDERNVLDFAGHSRADLRLGKDALGELYMLSKVNGKIWRVTPTEF